MMNCSNKTSFTPLQRGTPTNTYTGLGFPFQYHACIVPEYGKYFCHQSSCRVAFTNFLLGIEPTTGNAEQPSKSHQTGKGLDLMIDQLQGSHGSSRRKYGGSRTADLSDDLGSKQLVPELR